MEEILKILSCNYGLEFIKLRDDIELSGSPERSKTRFALEDIKGNIFVAEEVFNGLEQRKVNISKILEELKNNGLKKALTYLENQNSSYLTKVGKSSWQVIPYIKGIDLDRNSYFFEAWRGEHLGEFLCGLKKSSESLNSVVKPFSIIEYIHELNSKIEIHEKELGLKVKPIIDFLEKNLFQVHKELKTGFCHGDFHPVNVIWGENEIRTVIDWEFCGIKPEIYDLANLVGCLGMENPEVLAGELVESLFLKIRNLYENKSFKYILDYIIALRFAWLSEWLRKEDDEMKVLEITYMNLLIDNYEEIKNIWNF